MRENTDSEIERLLYILSVREHVVSARERDIALHLIVREHAVRERDIAPPQREGACGLRERERDFSTSA